ncbi:MAG: DUF2817 domain-containing protein [Candidatus Hydrogenedentota bacterium]
MNRSFFTKKRIALVCLAIVLAVCLGCGLYVRAKVRQPRAPYLHAQALRNLDNVAFRLHNAAEKEHLSLDTLGTVAYGDFAAPFWRVRYTPPQAAVRTVLVTGGVHGSEPMGAESVLRFIELLARTTEDYPDTAFVILPMVNPWGYVHNRRLNQQGRDINRDFGPFKTQEARFTQEALDGAQFDMVIDHHEDNTATGFYLYDLATPDETACREVIGAVRDAGHPIEQDAGMVIMKTDDGVIDTPVWPLHVAAWTVGNSLANYARLNHAATVFLLESPGRLRPEARLEMHALARQQLLIAAATAPGA